MKRTPMLLAALAAVALFDIGCGSSPSPEAGAGRSGDAARPTTAQTQAVEFAECMRRHGVRAFPDPEPSGELSLDGVLNGSSIDPESAEWKQAIATCRDVQPPGFTGQARSSGQQEVVLEFAQCMREHGVQDFPDPAEGEPIIDTNRIPSANSAGGMAILDAAMKACSEFAAGMGVTRP